MISFCFNVKNRSKVNLGNNQLGYLFPNCLNSLLEAWNNLPSQFHHELEIIIADWKSIDWPLEDWVPSKLDGVTYKLITLNGKYHNGKGRNEAAKMASGEIIFFLDADMLINAAVIKKGVHIVENKDSVYLPISFYLIDPDNTNGFWCAGKGNCMINQTHFKITSGWPEPPFYNKNYDEDQAFAKRLLKNNIQVIRAREPGFWHQFHPGKSVNSVQKPSQRHFIMKTKNVPNDKSVGVNFIINN